MPAGDSVLGRTLELASEFLAALPQRPVGSRGEYRALLTALGDRMPDEGDDAVAVVEHLASAVAPGLVATAGPRFFGFVIGGSLPAALAADWLTGVWDQNAFSYATSPAAAAVEECARRWLLDLLGLPPGMSAGFVTGGTMANFTCLAAARHALLASLNWDVEQKGLFGAPEITVIASAESHVSVFASLQMLGLGRERVIKIETDAQGRMQVGALRDALPKVDTPFLVCAQAGNVNTGSFDPTEEIVVAVRKHSRQSSQKSWLHLDGAFGGWVLASPSMKALARGIEQADSLALDSHKWLNVPYDNGLALIADSDAHRLAMTLHAAYYAPPRTVERDNHNWVAEASRRARGFTVYAALRSLGRQGVARMIERCSVHARRMAELLRQDSAVEILNEVVLNQVLVRFSPPAGISLSKDAFTGEVIRRVQNEGTCWLSGTEWHGMRAMRISVSNWSTTEEDVAVCAAAILRCVHY